MKNDNFRLIERDVKVALINHLINKGYPRDSILEEVELNGTGYIADIVVIKDSIEFQVDQNIKHKLSVDNVLEVYEIKSVEGVKRAEQLNSRIGILLKEIANYTLVFYVYFDEKESLVFKEINKSIVSKFRSFYNALENHSKVSDDYVTFFRGHADVKYNIEPGIYRKSPTMRGVNEEDILFKEGVRHCPSEFHNNTTTFEKLVKMQHYNLPTRLLDITTNPLVALYFACCTSDNTNGEVLIFHIKKDKIKYFDSDTVSILSNIAKRPYNFSSIGFKGSSSESFLLHEIRNEKPHFQDLINENDVESVLCVLPKLDNPRIQKQAGAFFVYGVKGDNKKMAPISAAPKRIVISSGGKKDILKELAILGIDHSTLFPDIDNILKTLKNK